MVGGILDRVVGANSDLAGGLEHRARRVSARRLAVVRFVTLPVVAVLAALSSSVNRWQLGVACTAGVAEVLLTSAWIDRARELSRAWWIVLPLALDITLLTFVLDATGGADSRVLLIFFVLPAVAAYVVSMRFVVALGLLALPLYAIVIGGGDPLAVYAIEGSWAIAVGAALAIQLHATLLRFRRLDRMLGALAGTPEDIVRHRVGAELRDVALGPLTRIAAETRLPGADLRALTESLAAAIARTRSAVSDLHAMSGAAGGLEGALARLGERRAPGARVTVEVDPVAEERATAGGGLNMLVAAMTRDALGVVAAAPVSEVMLAVRARGESGVQLEVRADGQLARRGGREDRALMARVAAADGKLERVEGVHPGVRVSVRDLNRRVALDARIPGQAVRGAAIVLATLRLLAAPAAAGVALVVGGHTAAFPYLTAAICLAGVAIAWVLVRTRMTLVQHTVTVSCDLALLAAWLLTVGDAAQHAIQPMTLVFPLAYGLMLGPRVVLWPSVVAGLVTAVLVDADVAFVIAFLFAIFVGLMTSVGGLWIADTLGRTAGRRTVLLARALAEEDEARRELAAQLHDDVLQLMLTARQDLEEAAEGNPEALAEGIAQLDAARATLQRAVSQLDIDEDAEALTGGLEAALRSAAAETERRATARVVVHVDPDTAGIADGLIVRVARELLVNVAKHAAAEHVELRTGRNGDGIVLEVLDDGVGFDRALVEDAVENGHIGLAAASERVRAAGGQLDLLDRSGGGAYVRVTLPRRG